MAAPGCERGAAGSALSEGARAAAHEPHAAREVRAPELSALAPRSVSAVLASHATHRPSSSSS